MTNAEMIKALRWCSSDDEQHEMCVDESYSCPMWNEDRMTDYCKADLMLNAADLIEAQQKQIAKLEAQLPKEGEWIDAYIGGNLHKRCPRCGTYIEATFFANDYDVSFCPVCGSRMRKGEQE